MPLAKQCRILLFHDVYLYYVAKLMHTIFYTGSVNKYNLKHPIFTRPVLNIDLRDKMLNFPVSYVRTSCRSSSVFIQGISIWNALPNYLKSEVSLTKFLHLYTDRLYSSYQ
jgi:hypothetical protein